MQTQRQDHMETTLLKMEKKSIRIAGTGTSDKSKRKGKQDEIATKSLRQFINKIMR